MGGSPQLSAWRRSLTSWSISRWQRSGESGRARRFGIGAGARPTRVRAPARGRRLNDHAVGQRLARIAARWVSDKGFTASRRVTPDARVALGNTHIVHEAGPLLRGLAEHPADRLADEELLFLEHCVCVLREPVEVTFSAAQTAEQGEEGRAPDPEVVVGGPTVEDIDERRVSLHEGSDHRRRKAVDECPRARLA